MPVVPFIPAIIGAAGAIGGAAIASNGAKKAANAQTASAAEANALQKYQYDTTRADQAPWRTAGMGGLNSLTSGFNAGQQTPDYAGYLVSNPDLANNPWLKAQVTSDLTGDGVVNDQDLAKYHYDNFGQAEGRQMGQTTTQGPGGVDFNHRFGMADFQADPGYQFTLSEGMNQLNSGLDARGLLNSGGAQKAALKYATGLANQTYGDAYNRYNSDVSGIYNRLASMAGLGQTANGVVGAAGAAYANNVGNNTMAAGDARANGIANQSNIATNALGQVAGFGSNLLGQYGGQPNPAFAYNPTSMATNYGAVGGASNPYANATLGGSPNFSTVNF